MLQVTAEVPFHNEDLDNGTMPAVLNNAIDWLSRPYGAGAVVGKPLAVIGTTPTPEQ